MSALCVHCDFPKHSHKQHMGLLGDAGACPIFNKGKLVDWHPVNRFKPREDVMSEKAAKVETLKCPQCGHALKPVTYHGGAMALNRDQWESVRAGDWYCDKCKSNVSNTGYKYYWNRELVESPATVQPPTQQCPRCGSDDYETGDNCHQCHECRMCWPLSFTPEPPPQPAGGAGEKYLAGDGLHREESDLSSKGVVRAGGVFTSPASLEVEERVTSAADTDVSLWLPAIVNELFPNAQAGDQFDLDAILSAIRKQPCPRCAELETRWLAERDDLKAKLSEKFPAIGQDPLKMEKRDGFEEAFARLKSGLDRQQSGVPDQTALVWRADISRVSDELIVQRARGESFMSAMRQVDELKEKLAVVERHMEHCRSVAGVPDDETLAVHLAEMKARGDALEKALREILNHPSLPTTVRQIANAALAGKENS